MSHSTPAPATQWPDLEVPIAIAGRVVPVEHTEFALSRDQGQLPFAHILAEATRVRDAREAVLSPGKA